jgi:hypothetical protein
MSPETGMSVWNSDRSNLIRRVRNSLRSVARMKFPGSIPRVGIACFGQRRNPQFLAVESSNGYPWVELRKYFGILGRGGWGGALMLR